MKKHILMTLFFITFMLNNCQVVSAVIDYKKYTYLFSLVLNIWVITRVARAEEYI